MACTDTTTTQTAAEQLAAKLSQPKSIQTDGAKVDNHSISDLLAYQKYLDSKEAMKCATRGLRFSIIKPPGTV